MPLEPHSKIVDKVKLPLVKADGIRIKKAGEHLKAISGIIIGYDTYWLLEHEDGGTILGKEFDDGAPHGIGIIPFNSAEEAEKMVRLAPKYEKITHWLDPEAIKKCIVEKHADFVPRED